MASLQIRDLPNSLEKKLKEEAKKSHRSLAQQAIVSLQQGLGLTGDTKERRISVVKGLKETPFITGNVKLKDPLELIQEDRSR